MRGDPSPPHGRCPYRSSRAVSNDAAVLAPTPAKRVPPQPYRGKRNRGTNARLISGETLALDARVCMEHPSRRRLNPRRPDR